MIDNHGGKHQQSEQAVSQKFRFLIAEGDHSGGQQRRAAEKPLPGEVHGLHQLKHARGGDQGHNNVQRQRKRVVEHHNGRHKKHQAGPGYDPLFHSNIPLQVFLL